MKTQLLHVLETATLAVAPRSRAGHPIAIAPATAGNADATSWSTAIRTSMTVPAFHGRWPLCSPT